MVFARETAGIFKKDREESMKFLRVPVEWRRRACKR
jgi:hypothetical protein